MSARIRRFLGLWMEPVFDLLNQQEAAGRETLEGGEYGDSGGFARSHIETGVGGGGVAVGEGHAAVSVNFH